MNILRRVPTAVILAFDIILTIIFMAHEMQENQKANEEHFEETIEWVQEED